MSTIGIDLGTTLSRMALLDDEGRPEVMENAEGELMTPSVVYFGDEGVVVGKEALVSGRDFPERTVRYAKRWLGDPKMSWEIDGAFYTPVDVSAFILRKLKDDFEKQRGPITRAVITVPAHFDAHQRRLTLEAGQQAGFPQVDLVNEPVAAALMYVMGAQKQREEGVLPDQRLLVYDLGGGTFDLSLVRYKDEEMTVLASAGDLQLGGIDWNERIVDQVAQRFEQTHGINLRQDRIFMSLMDERAEVAKCTLTNPAKSRTFIIARNRGLEVRLDISRPEFEEWTRDLVERTRTLTEQLVRDANLDWHHLNRLLVVGGSTRMPMIQAVTQELQQRMQERFGLATETHVSPVFSVAQGAALYGRILSGKSGGGTTSVMTVNSHGVGILVRNNGGDLVNHVVIPRNTLLPYSATFKVGTVRDNQERIHLKIVEGDETGYNPQAICECRISHLPPGLPEGSVFEVSLMLESNGLLQVVARHQDSGLLSTVTVRRGRN